MTEENTEGTEITPEQIQAAKDLLTSEKVGFNVMDSESLGKRLAKERSKAERDLEALRADMDSLKANHDELKAYKKEAEDQGKSDLELLNGQYGELKKDRDGKLSELEQLQADLETERKNNSDFKVNLKLRSALKDPINPDVAMMWAMKNLPGLSVDDTGEFVYTESTGDVLEGPAAIKRVSDWWATQVDLQRPKAPGPDTKGNPSAPILNTSEYKPLDPSADLQDRIKHAAKHNPVQYPID